jgi:ABC-type lipoprotein export system ATPase subunit
MSRVNQKCSQHRSQGRLKFPNHWLSEVLGLFSRLHEEGKTVVIVTHDPLVAAKATRQVQLENGRLV